MFHGCKSPSALFHARLGPCSWGLIWLISRMCAESSYLPCMTSPGHLQSSVYAVFICQKPSSVGRTWSRRATDTSFISPFGSNEEQIREGLYKQLKEISKPGSASNDCGQSISGFMIRVTYAVRTEEIIGRAIIPTGKSFTTHGTYLNRYRKQINPSHMAEQGSRPKIQVRWAFLYQKKANTFAPITSSPQSRHV